MARWNPLNDGAVFLSFCTGNVSSNAISIPSSWLSSFLLWKKNPLMVSSWFSQASARLIKDSRTCHGTTVRNKYKINSFCTIFFFWKYHNDLFWCTVPIFYNGTQEHGAFISFLFVMYIRIFKKKLAIVKKLKYDRRFDRNNAGRQTFFNLKKNIVPVYTMKLTSMLFSTTVKYSVE